MASSRQEMFSGTREVAAGLEIDAGRLERHLLRHVEGFAGPLRIRQFKGGQSNPTYLLTTPGRRYVLRRKPPGRLLPSAHAVDREYRVIKALGPTPMPVPEALHLCTDESVAGTMFFVMSFAEGRVLWEPTLPGMDPAERYRHYAAMAATLAVLHRQEPAAIGLGEFGRPGNYFARQIARWSKQYRASETGRIEAMDRLMAWLPDNIPDSDESAVVHGDYRLDNMIFDPDEPRVLAVLDWELSTLGHPLADFTYQLMAWRTPGALFNGLADSDLKALGIPDEAEYTRLYCEAAGRGPIADLDFYMAYNMFRIAAILQGIAGRVRDGTATSAHAAERGAMVRPFADLAWSFARRAG